MGITNDFCFSNLDKTSNENMRSNNLLLIFFSFSWLAHSEKFMLFYSCINLNEVWCQVNWEVPNRTLFYNPNYIELFGIDGGFYNEDSLPSVIYVEKE